MFSAAHESAFEERLRDLANKFDPLFDGDDFVDAVIIEGVEHHGSVKGIASERSGSIHKLAYIVGAFMQIAHMYNSRVYLILPSRWKGQLPDDVIDRRLLSDMGRKFHRHEAEAVALGLWAQGKK